MKVVRIYYFNFTGDITGKKERGRRTQEKNGGLARLFSPAFWLPFPVTPATQAKDFFFDQSESVSKANAILLFDTQLKTAPIYAISPVKDVFNFSVNFTFRAWQQEVHT